MACFLLVSIDNGIYDIVDRVMRTSSHQHDDDDDDDDDNVQTSRTSTPSPTTYLNPLDPLNYQNYQMPSASEQTCHTPPRRKHEVKLHGYHYNTMASTI
ncbi:hypothetical protein Tco_0329792, partial [Tanacetum coccineum]